MSIFYLTSLRHMVYKGVLCEKVCEKTIIHPGIGGKIRGKKVRGRGKETAAGAGKAFVFRKG